MYLCENHCSDDPWGVLGLVKYIGRYTREIREGRHGLNLLIDIIKIIYGLVNNLNLFTSDYHSFRWLHGVCLGRLNTTGRYTFQNLEAKHEHTRNVK